MSHQLTIEPLGATIAVAAGQSMLDAALRAGIWLPYACNHGLCGTCKVEVLDGCIEHNHASSFALMDIERDEGKCLACCATLTADTVIEAELDRDPDARGLAVRDHVATVTRIEELTPTIKGIRLAPDGDGVDFQAGQYLNLVIPGLAQPRAFSIASPPSRRHELELNVRLVEGGAGTGWLHHRLTVGSRLGFTAPLGRFFVRRSSSAPLLFLAGGSGLSSPLSMIEDVLESGDPRPLTLIHGARSPDELYYVAHLRALAAAHANFTYLPAVAGEYAGEWDGARGFVHEVAERHFDGRFAGQQAYLCGPPAMIDACLTSLMRGRLFEQHIFTENFFSAADGARTARRSALFKKF